MYDQALRVAPLETAAELYKSVMESHHRWCSQRVRVDLLHHVSQSFSEFHQNFNRQELLPLVWLFLPLHHLWLWPLLRPGHSQVYILFQQIFSTTLFVSNFLISESYTVWSCVCSGSTVRWKEDEWLNWSCSPPILRKFKDNPFHLELTKMAFLQPELAKSSCDCN